MAERFEMRLEQDVLDRLDTWRAKQIDPPSRAGAVRRLLEAGLETQENTQPKISDGEKLILIMLGEVYKSLKIEGDIDPEFVAKAIYGGHHWGLQWSYSGIFHGHEDDAATVSEVVNILDMWTFLERGAEQLSNKDQERVVLEADPLGKNIKYRGFDGNNETKHLSIASFLINDLKRFSKFKDRGDLNSHMPVIETYRRMLSVFMPMRRTLTGGELTADQIIDILKAMKHPERR